MSLGGWDVVLSVRRVLGDLIRGLIQSRTLFYRFGIVRGRRKKLRGKGLQYRT